MKKKNTKLGKFHINESSRLKHDKEEAKPDTSRGEQRKGAKWMTPNRAFLEARSSPFSSLAPLRDRAHDRVNWTILERSAHSAWNIQKPKQWNAENLPSQTSAWTRWGLWERGTKGSGGSQLDSSIFTFGCIIFNSQSTFVFGWIMHFQCACVVAHTAVAHFVQWLNEPVKHKWIVLSSQRPHNISRDNDGVTAASSHLLAWSFHSRVITVLKLTAAGHRVMMPAGNLICAYALCWLRFHLWILPIKKVF